jgi:predicted nucleic acid-binding protein
LKKILYFDTSALIKEFDEREAAHDLMNNVTTAAREGKLQIILSSWTINEANAVFDRKHHRRKEITKIEMQTIIATLSQRIRDSVEHSDFRIAPVEQVIVANSRMLIEHYHISADDALHLYTAWLYDCDFFLAHDDDFVRVKHHQQPPLELQNMIIDLADETDRKRIESQFNL